ncbi:alanine/glycine:cation symporter family protein [Nocardiopsis potens]|uniref:alanine/glycine:cation symporter family protein n=1 Tax=Nocardiopsis potens TaxID=1246458 RepID=UPI00034D4194|nr:alanine/glycine:cation symporter family protein [Nocardiopsis potens]
MDRLNEFIVTTTDAFWLWLLIPLLVLLSLYFTVRLGAVQIRLIPEMLRQFRGRPETAADGKKAVSPFQAFSISAAARIGTGNVVGVAGAIAIGGPGAVFWMWVMALLVGAASFVESTLAQLYKVRDSKGFHGGPAYYMTRGLNARWAGVVFAVLITVTFGFVFNAVQSNTISGAVRTSVEATGAEVPGWLPVLIGLALVAVTAAVVFGGVRRIAQVAQALVPFMALFYILMGLAVVALNAEKILPMLTLIVQSAFGLREVAGAALGTVIVQGVRRGMFSNEAGLGSAPNAAATASVSHPVKQGLLQTFGVYFDTLVICSMTAFLILVSDPVYGEERGPALTQEALQGSLGSWSLHALTAVLLLLAFTSVLGNYYYGEANVRFLSGKRGVMLGFQLVFLVATFLGAIGKVDVVWSLADTTMGLMAMVNLLAIAPLGGIALLLLKDYVAQRRQGLDPVFTRDRLPQLRNVECWEPSRPEAEPAAER